MRKVKLTKGFTAKIDNADFEKVSAHKWHCTVHPTNGVMFPRAARRSSTFDVESLAEFLIGRREGMQIIYKNSNGLDCQRANIAHATVSERNATQRKRKGCSSKFKGVSWYGRKNRWSAQCAGINLGMFKDEKEAAKKYNTAAWNRWGSFARLNKV